MTPLETVLEMLGVRLRGTRNRQNVRCPNVDAHKHRDRTPSMHIDLEKQYARCYACGLHGNPVWLLHELKGMSLREAQQHCNALDDGSGRAVQQARDVGGILPPKARPVGRRRSSWLPPGRGA
jgi:hypothetical protein